MTTTALTGQPTLRGRFGRVTLHFFEMCAPMCVGFAIGDLIYFWTAGKFGYSHRTRSRTCQSCRYWSSPSR
jgi:hypothetical protein